MVFSSLLFLYAYLPLALLCTFCVPRRWRNAALFAVSLLFYAWGEPQFVVVMLLSMTVAYVFGFFIERARATNMRRAKLLLCLSVGIDLSLLFFFKYYNFFAENLSRLPFVNLPVASGLRLPIGISFYTFQILSYTVDLWRGECRLQKSLVSFGTYVTLFPQLIAGPIVRYTDVDAQLTGRRESVALFSSGVVRFCTGLAKKVLLGDALAAGALYFRQSFSALPTALGAWSIAILYSLHLYFDFSGYSDMAIGLGRMLGFRFPENFNYPYISKSITEFWRRWHITLSAWFREYVYIPLGGNRRGRGRQLVNLCAVWLLTGLWHGAAWNFVLWGAYFAVLLIAEKLFLLRLLARLPSAFGHLYALFFIAFGFLIFSTGDMGELLTLSGALLGIGTAPADAVIRYRLLRLLPLVCIAAVCATPLPRRLWEHASQKMPRLDWAKPALSAALLLLCTAYLVDSTFSPFAYTQF